MLQPTRLCKNRAFRSNLLRKFRLNRLRSLKASFAVKVDADFHFEIGIAG
jgi:hypothetical protein